jgi:hypothetical protein
MKPNVLRAPLINSAIVLIILSLLVYLTSTSPEGSVWASIATIVVSTVKAVQWAIALAIGLVVSLAVLFGIFFGAVAMVNPASASRMYEGLRQTLLLWFGPVINLFKSNRQEKMSAALAEFGTSLKSEIAADIQGVQANLAKAQTEMESRLTTLSSRITALEETVSSLAPGEQVEALAEELTRTSEAVTAIQGTVDGLKTTVDQAAQQAGEISPEKILGDLPARIETLEQQEMPEVPAPVDITPLEQTVASLQAELTAVQKKAEEALELAAKKPAPAVKPVQAAAKKAKMKAVPKKEEEHRIFSYFDDPADKKKVAELVADTLKKDMSYKQAMEHVAKGLGGKKGAIITSHPSLSKDYIRQCRRKSS